MEIQGKLVQLLPLQTGTGKNGTWKKQECILEIPGQFPKKVCFAIWGDKISESLLQIGNDLTVHFDIESREYNARWYTEIKAWKVEGKMKSENKSQIPDSELPPPLEYDFEVPTQNDIDLPF